MFMLFLSNRLRKIILIIVIIVVFIFALFLIINSFSNKYYATPLNENISFNMSSDGLHDTIGEPDEVSNNDIVLKTFEYYTEELQNNKNDITYVFKNNRLIEVDYSIDLNDEHNVDEFIYNLENDFIEFYEEKYNSVEIKESNSLEKLFTAGKGRYSVIVFIYYESNVLHVSCTSNR